MFSVDVAGFWPGVTDVGLNINEVLPGNPLAEKVIGFVKALFIGVIVIPYFASCPALTVMEPGARARVKSGGAVTVTTSTEVSLAVFSSPPPDTVTMLVTLAGAFAATLTVKMIAG
jgi:hypothetical protein